MPYKKMEETMKTVLKVIVIMVVLGALMSCASLNVPVSATSNEMGVLVGQSSGIIWLGILGNVDAGIKDAAQDGKILHISTVDFEYASVLFGLGTKYTCTVTGK